MSNNVSPDEARRAALLSAFNDYLTLPTRMLAPDLAAMVASEGMAVQGCSVAAATLALKDEVGKQSIERFVVFSVVGTNWQNMMPIFGRFLFDEYQWLHVMKIAQGWMEENPDWESRIDQFRMIDVEGVEGHTEGDVNHDGHTN